MINVTWPRGVGHPINSPLPLKKNAPDFNPPKTIIIYASYN